MSEWISVKDRLPELHETVLAYDSLYNEITKVKLSRSHKGDLEWAIYDSDEGYSIPFNSVTHWMPLPEPPKEPNLE